jgi:hypothetical protein
MWSVARSTGMSRRADHGGDLHLVVEGLRSRCDGHGVARPEHRRGIGEVEDRNPVPDRIHLAADGLHGGHDVLLERHEVPDRRRYRDRSPQRDVLERHRFQRIVRRRGGGTGQFVRVGQQGQQSVGTAQAVHHAVPHDTDVVMAVSW